VTCEKPHGNADKGGRSSSRGRVFLKPVIRGIRKRAFGRLENVVRQQNSKAEISLVIFGFWGTVRRGGGKV